MHFKSVIKLINYLFFILEDLFQGNAKVCICFYSDVSQKLGVLFPGI